MQGHMHLLKYIRILMFHSVDQGALFQHWILVRNEDKQHSMLLSFENIIFLKKTQAAIESTISESLLCTSFLTDSTPCWK